MTSEAELNAVTAGRVMVEAPGQWISPSLRLGAFESFVHAMLLEMQSESGDHCLQEVLIKVWNDSEFDEKIGVVPDADYKLQGELTIAEQQLTEKNEELRKVRATLQSLQRVCRKSKSAVILSVLKCIEQEAP